MMLEKYFLRKKHQTKRDLREIKKKYKAFRWFKMDVKYLNDLPHYWPYMTAMGLPRFQYTLVEVRVGATFLAYADTFGVAESEAVVRRFLLHLEEQGIPLDEVLIQTDGGGEFDGTVIKRKPDGFTHTIEEVFGAMHRVVPGCPNAQAEAESLHSRIEPEFFDIEDFFGPHDFWHRIATWQNWYNLRRKNRSRGWKCPAENLREIEPQRDRAIFLLPPVHVDILLAAQGGYHVPVDPVQRPGRYAEHGEFRQAGGAWPECPARHLDVARPSWPCAPTGKMPVPQRGHSRPRTTP